MDQAQAFLQQLLPAMEQGVMLLVPLGILLAIILPLKDRSYVAIFKKMLKWGFFLSLFMVAVKTGTRQAVSREIFEAVAIVIAFASEATLLFILLRKKEDELTGGVAKLFRLAIAAAVLSLFLYHGMELWLIPVGFVQAAGDDPFTFTVLVKLIGYLVGLFLGGLAGFLVYEASAALNHKRLIFVFVVQEAGTILQQLIFFLQVLLARRVLDSEILLSLMAPIIDHQDWVIFIIFFVTLVVPFTLFSQPKPEKLPEWNPAEYRKVLARAIHKRRWGTALLVALVILCVLSSAGSYYAYKEVELVPAEPVKAENGIVSIPLTTVQDGHLHRYAYRAADGTTVRVIIILKGGSAYGVGLDACEICGPTGYYEQDNQVICKLCNVMMNKATIGMPGGCNPVPITYQVDNGSVTIKAADLDKESKRFR